MHLDYCLLPLRMFLDSCFCGPCKGLRLADMLLDLF